MSDPFRAKVTATGIETNRGGALASEELDQIDKLRMVARIIERYGASAVGLRVVVFPG